MWELLLVGSACYSSALRNSVEGVYRLFNAIRLNVASPSQHTRVKEGREKHGLAYTPTSALTVLHGGAKVFVRHDEVRCSKQVASVSTALEIRYRNGGEVDCFER